MQWPPRHPLQDRHMLRCPPASLAFLGRISLFRRTSSPGCPSAPVRDLPADVRGQLAWNGLHGERTFPPHAADCTAEAPNGSCLLGRPRGRGGERAGGAVPGPNARARLARPWRRQDQHGSLSHGYTTLKNHICLPFLKAVAGATKEIDPTDAHGEAAQTLHQRQPIHLILPGGRNRTIFGAHSMKQVSHDTACLAFLDAGPKAEQAVVIGGFQLERPRLSFSSTPYAMKTTCGNFGLTLEAEVEMALYCFD
ncbi:aspartic [Musa troglodytarum]|uniref:Aspartic n=1 Tax=Musa troglodytarum TaxID=320322 RepID=A0A9E7FGE1_9LILI|nr:aspartic [Musa troglodytarum]